MKAQQKHHLAHLIASRGVRARMLLLLCWIMGIMTLPQVPLPTRAQDEDESQIEALLAAMSLEDQVGQLFMVNVPGVEMTTPIREFLSTMKPGAIVMFGSNGTSPEVAARVINEWQSLIVSQEGGIPLLIASDHEGGAVMRLREGFTAFPWAAALGAMPVAETEKVGRLVGLELRAVGVNMNLAPVADVRAASDVPLFMERRALGHDPERVGAAVSAYVRGLQQSGVISTLKHFPGHGAAGDSHQFLPVLYHSRADLDQIDLIPFEMGIEAGAEVVMVGHLSVPSLEPEPGLPATLSHRITTDLLRRELGFQGVIMTDALDMGAIVDNFTAERAAIMAAQAGADILAIGPLLDLQAQLSMKKAVVEAVQSGSLSADQVKESVRRILRLKVKYNLLNWRPVDPLTVSAAVNSTEHQKQLDQFYLQAVSIGYDQAGLLPLKEGQRVGVVYPASLGEIRNACVSLGGQGVPYTLNPTGDEISAALRLVGSVEVIIVFTFDIQRYPRQAALVNALPADRVIVVALDNPYDFEKGIAPGAYITAFNAVPSAFRAACAIIAGKHNPVGVFSAIPG